jgi:hypothetical protein
MQSHSNRITAIPGLCNGKPTICGKRLTVHTFSTEIKPIFNKKIFRSLFLNNKFILRMFELPDILFFEYQVQKFFNANNIDPGKVN